MSENTMEDLSFYFLTWNVVTTQPLANEHLLKLCNTQADFIAVGLQEVKSQPQNLVVDALNEDSWTNALRDTLAPHGFVKIHTIRLVGIILSLFSKREHITSIRNIETSYTRTGLGGLWGNKGAVSIRFNFKGSSICLVNCHLTPHDNMITNRIADYNTIIKSQSFQKEKIHSILDHDMIFWFGDLNFRLDTKPNFTAQQIVDLVSRNNLQSLLQYDELYQVRTNRDAFEDFAECEIKFNPTYKFIPHSTNYDFKRRPAWTDRVLYRTFNNSKSSDHLVKCKSYESYSNVEVSDHKPVSAHFDIQVKGGALPKVEFEAIKSWSVGEVGKIVYRLPNNIPLSSWHWIAFYQENFSSFGEYFYYVWSSQRELPGRPGYYQVNVPENGLRVPGKYHAVFMSDTQPYDMLGISDIFEVQGI